MIAAGPLGALQLETYAITSRAMVPGGDVAARVEALLAAGVSMVQIREKDLPARALHRLCARIAAAAPRDRVLVNDRADIALACGIGVHLGVASLPVRAVRRLAPRARIGASTHTLDEARRAEDEGADFLVFGPVFATDSKRGFGPPRGVGELLQVVARARVPVFALGGIDAGGAAVLFDAGIHRIAGISLFMRGDVATTMRRLARRHATARYTSPSGVFPLSPERESTWP